MGATHPPMTHENKKIIVIKNISPFAGPGPRRLKANDNKRANPKAKNREIITVDNNIIYSI
jgi:hypothetical protein